MVSVLIVLNMVLDLFWWIIVLSAILSWLIAFNVVDTRNPTVNNVANVLWRLTEPVLAPIRRILPNLGGIDVSPVIALLIIFFLQDFNGRYLMPMARSAGL